MLAPIEGVSLVGYWSEVVLHRYHPRVRSRDWYGFRELMLGDGYYGGIWLV